MRPTFKVRRAHLVIRFSVCLCVCFLSVNPSHLYKVQYCKFRLGYSNLTWTISFSKGCLHFTEITCPWVWGGCHLRDFARILLYCCWGHP